MITEKVIKDNALKAQELLREFEKQIPIPGQEDLINRLITIVVYQQHEIEALKRALEVAIRGYSPHFVLEPLQELKAGVRAHPTKKG